MRITIFIAFLCSQFAYAQQVTITPEKKEQIKAYIKYFEENDKIMGAVSIMENGEELVNETFGELNRNSSSPLSNRKYTIGSITKLYTAVLFAKLVEDGKISFNEKLNNYFPEIPNAELIEIKHMLNHTSGLKDYVSNSEGIHFWLKEPRTQKEIIDEIITQGVSFLPGDSLDYSNSAYYLLGRWHLCV